jgi:hypothetical protein
MQGRLNRIPWTQSRYARKSCYSRPNIRPNSTTKKNGLPSLARRPLNLCRNLARPAGFEPTTPWFVARSSIFDKRFEINTLRAFICATVAELRPGKALESHFMWRPLLRDPADEMVLEAAVNGGAAAIVTFNQRDFGVVPQQFGVEVLTPAVALRRIK